MRFLHPNRIYDAHVPYVIVFLIFVAAMILFSRRGEQ